MWLGRIDDFPHFNLLVRRQWHVPRRPILLQPVRLGRARNGNHTLSGDPGERDLSRLASFPDGDLFYFVNDGTVLVEVLPLELGDCGGDLVMVRLACGLGIVGLGQNLLFRRKSFGAKSSGDWY
jgi:hypothetical protein